MSKKSIWPKKQDLGRFVNRLTEDEFKAQYLGTFMAQHLGVPPEIVGTQKVEVHTSGRFKKENGEEFCLYTIPPPKEEDLSANY